MKLIWIGAFVSVVASLASLVSNRQSGRLIDESLTSASGVLALIFAVRDRAERQAHEIEHGADPEKHAGDVALKGDANVVHDVVAEHHPVAAMRHEPAIDIGNA